ncbi:nucleotidyltransferase domain-containing protein [Bacteroides uniformis]|uniref:Nucleotidyltransferase domain-containing protein n=1 Tax=Bacteroides uniformis TaxID=820 RepID=A0A3E4XF77_BACUN|nr:nucleotidyltransferase domain-containing protein [Bacteroides uniformis]
MKRHGICWKTVIRICAVLARFDEVREAVLFGSRAKGNYKKGSDIDIAVKGPVEKDALAQLMMAFDESLLPYLVDVVVYANLENEALREHIDRVGVRIYVKSGEPSKKAPRRH